MDREEILEDLDMCEYCQNSRLVYLEDDEWVDCEYCLESDDDSSRDYNPENDSDYTAENDCDYTDDSDDSIGGHSSTY